MSNLEGVGGMSHIFQRSMQPNLSSVFKKVGTEQKFCRFSFHLYPEGKCDLIIKTLQLQIFLKKKLTAVLKTSFFASFFLIFAITSKD